MNTALADRVIAIIEEAELESARTKAHRAEVRHCLSRSQFGLVSDCNGNILVWEGPENGWRYC